MKKGNVARLVLLGAGGAVAIYGAIIRPRLLTWGATRDEVSRRYTGDEVIPDATGGAVMATTLPGPPESLWPWLVQMGGDRAGWYSWDALDNHGEPSARRIVPEWQNLGVGDHLAGPTNWWEVVAMEPCRSLVLRSSYSLTTTHSFDPRSDPLPRAFVDGIWGFHLKATSGGTRLVVCTRSRSGPRSIQRPFGLVGEPIHFVMQTRQFRNLRDRVESAASDAVPVGPQSGAPSSSM